MDKGLGSIHGRKQERQYETQRDLQRRTTNQLSGVAHINTPTSILSPTLVPYTNIAV